MHRGPAVAAAASTSRRASRQAARLPSSPAPSTLPSTAPPPRSSPTSVASSSWRILRPKPSSPLHPHPMAPARQPLCAISSRHFCGALSLPSGSRPSNRSAASRLPKRMRCTSCACSSLSPASRPCSQVRSVVRSTASQCETRRRRSSRTSSRRRPPSSLSTASPRSPSRPPRPPQSFPPESPSRVSPRCCLVSSPSSNSPPSPTSPGAPLKCYSTWRVRREIATHFDSTSGRSPTSHCTHSSPLSAWSPQSSLMFSPSLPAELPYALPTPFLRLWHVSIATPRCDGNGKV
mmetsp:Transcript_50706/g.113950  ORF Transcript_50706/g.113950 Transcript_50706/m.113950 type:complete len:291 (+) Transcript_50706:130-1002(+)